MKNYKLAFTLSEVLITLGIIGIVAALTLPAIMTKISDHVAQKQKGIIEAKLIQGLNLVDLEGSMNNKYSSSAEFLGILSKHMKISQICDGETVPFSKCFQYNEINYTSGNENKVQLLTEVTTPLKLGISEEYFNPAAFTLSDGTPIILSYKKDCNSDPDSIKPDNKTIHSCVAGVYDLNGGTTPNKYGKDIIGFNGGRFGIYSIINGVQILAPAINAPPVSCNDYKGKSGYDIKYCYFNDNNDRWVGALVECNKQGGRLPNSSETIKIAEEWLKAKKATATKLGINTTGFALWEDKEISTHIANSRDFSPYYNETVWPKPNWSRSAPYGPRYTICIPK